ncbi:MAG: arginine--tRNA ligase [Chloroflexota bacterium]|nr:arginine--tRNA ligase [Chloroflexota bacterium]
MQLTVRDNIVALISAGMRQAQAADALPAFEIPPAVPVAPSQHAAHGDYGSPVCMGLARVLRRAPIQIAQAIAPHIPQVDFISQVEVSPPGYLNFTLDKSWLAQQAPVILAAGESWGNLEREASERVQVEFVSANPTGPLTVGAARNAVLGDALASVLDAAGYAVEREYYVNDHGSKSRKLAVSIYLSYAELWGAPVELDEPIYPGDYIAELAEELQAEAGRRYLAMERDAALAEIMEWGIQRVLAGVEADLAQLRIHFDSWRHERSFYTGEPSLFEQQLCRLRETGHIVEKDGATWFTHPDLEKDAVLVRSAEVIADPESRPTYLASDICYLWDKLVLRDFDRAIYVWGADHHGDVPRVEAAAQALGIAPERVMLILYQLVTMRRGEQALRMSKSSGEFVTLREVIEEVGADSIRYMLLTRTADVTMDFDLELAVEQSDRNPVFYVQYAHTRIAGVLRHAAEQGWPAEVLGDPALLTQPSELALLRKMVAFPEMIALAANNLAPHHLPNYASELAALFHAFYHNCHIVSSDPAGAELTRARLMLARTAKVVLARVLHLMGMAAPERM